MATIDDLTNSTTALLNAVNVSKATLDAAATLATSNGAAQVALATAQKNSAATLAAAASTSATAAASAQTAAAASAASAAAIVGIPPAYTNLVTQPNRITVDTTIPDGNNAIIFGDFEVSPDVTVTGLGNANFVGLG